MKEKQKGRRNSSKFLFDRRLSSLTRRLKYKLNKDKQIRSLLDLLDLSTHLRATHEREDVVSIASFNQSLEVRSFIKCHVSFLQMFLVKSESLINAIKSCHIEHSGSSPRLKFILARVYFTVRNIFKIYSKVKYSTCSLWNDNFWSLEKKKTYSIFSLVNLKSVTCNKVRNARIVQLR